MGLWRIGLYLQRYHEITIGDSTIYRILKRHGLGRLPHNQAHKPHHQKWRRSSVGALVVAEDRRHVPCGYSRQAKELLAIHCH
jgi:hypothetical protein